MVGLNTIGAITYGESISAEMVAADNDSTSCAREASASISAYSDSRLASVSVLLSANSLCDDVGQGRCMYVGVVPGSELWRTCFRADAASVDHWAKHGSSPCFI